MWHCDCFKEGMNIGRNHHAASPAASGLWEALGEQVATGSIAAGVAGLGAASAARPLSSQQLAVRRGPVRPFFHLYRH